MKKLGFILILTSILIISIYYIFHSFELRYETKQIDNYINNTSKSDTNRDILDNKTTNSKKSSDKKHKKLDYTAILEIPNIKLKQGVVDAIKNYNSIKYAISVDKNSNYPDKPGNFILYAHSGNSSIAYFKNLYKVNINDKIYVYYNGIKYEYNIVNKYNIEKNGKAKILNSKNNHYITLITCNQEMKGYQIVLLGNLISKTTY